MSAGFGHVATDKEKHYETNYFQFCNVLSERFGPK